MKSRRSALRAVREGMYDVCIIGGGATGMGCALDAQLRRLSTVLVEAGDFVSQTSAASTKLVHGGVRYLEEAVKDLDYWQYAMVKKALHERIHMLRRAPYLAHALELLVPCFSWWELGYFTAGMKAYDWIADEDSLFPSRMLSKDEALALMPGLRSEKLVGAVAYADGQFDDARYGLALAQTLAQQGGELINYAKAVGFDKDAEGKLVGLEAEDQVGGDRERLRIRAKVFVNCTGPFADHIRVMANPAMPERLRLSKGVHLLLPVEAIQSEAALLVPKTKDGRVIFAIPWLGRLLVGTTEDEAQLTDEMVVTPDEIGYLLGYVNQYLKVNLTPDDVLAGFAGLRPLVKSKVGVKTRQLIRDHEIEVDEGSGLISVLGGKWTTYRAMAEDGIDCAEREMAGETTTCKTLDFALTGTEGFWEGYWKQLAERYCLAWGTARHLAEKFGTDAPKVMELAEKDARLRQPLIEGGVAIRAEVVYVIREEMAQTIEDVLRRRIGVQLHGWKEAARAAPMVCQLLAEELDWSEAQSREALEGYLASIRHLLDSAGLD